MYSKTWARALTWLCQPGWRSGFRLPLEPLRESASALLAGMVQVLPWLAALVGWLAPIIWVIWFFGMLLLLALAIGLHWWLSSRQRSAPVNPRRFVA